MMRFLTWLFTTAVALAAAAWIMDGIRFTGANSGMDEVRDKLPELLIVALILGLVSSVVKPVLQLLSLPLIILTLGLFLLVINAAMLLLTSWLAEQFDLGFHVNGFWTAVGGAIIITITTWLVDRVVGDAA